MGSESFWLHSLSNLQEDSGKFVVKSLLTRFATAEV